jgi:DNA-binding NarL/FixJ family response regulator
MENCLLRDALSNRLRRQGEIEIVGRSGPGERGKEGAKEGGCDILLMDFFEKECNPEQRGTSLNAMKGAARILIGMNDDYEQFIAAVRWGVRGYLLKEASAAEVVGAVRAVFRGEAVCPPQMCSKLFEMVSRMKSGQNERGARGNMGLTLKQQKVMGLVARGMTNKEIAARLNLSEFTVKNHLRRIMKQVEATSRSQAVETMLSHGCSLKSFEGSA